jgi:hypothetical protein
MLKMQDNTTNKDATQPYQIINAISAVNIFGKTKRLHDL